MTPEIRLTDHAMMRMRERTGLSRKAAKRLVARAMERGLSVEQTHGCLHHYLAKKIDHAAAQEERMYVRLYGEMLYLFRETTDAELLITAFLLPGPLKKQARTHQIRQKQKNMQAI